MKRAAQILKLIFVVALLITAPANSANGKELRLVCSLDCAIEPLTHFELRKLFLGLSVNSPDGQNIVPIRNYSDEDLKDIFHQALIGMTENSYKRKLLQSRMNFAAQEPSVIKDESALLNKLKSSARTVSFVWSTSEVITEDNSKIIQVLWSGEDIE